MSFLAFSNVDAPTLFPTNEIKTDRRLEWFKTVFEAKPREFYYYPIISFKIDYFSDVN